MEKEEKRGMERQDPGWQQQRAREELLLRFLKAYEEGNLEVFGAILQQAEKDPELDALIWEVFLTYLREEKHIEASAVESLSAVLQQPLPSDWKMPEPLPLTVADVAAQIQVDLTLHRAKYADAHLIQRALNTLVWSHDLLPDPIDLRAIQTILFQYELVVPPIFAEIFLQAAHKARRRNK